MVTAPDARTVHGRTSGGAAATVITSAARDRAVFLADRLPAAGEGRTYQLWLADGDTMHPAGFLAGDGAAVLDGDLGKATAVGLTLEPAGGSAQPTTSPCSCSPCRRRAYAAPGRVAGSEGSRHPLAGAPGRPSRVAAWPRGRVVRYADAARRLLETSAGIVQRRGSIDG